MSYYLWAVLFSPCYHPIHVLCFYMCISFLLTLVCVFLCRNTNPSLWLSVTRYIVKVDALCAMCAEALVISLSYQTKLMFFWFLFISPSHISTECWVFLVNQWGDVKAPNYILFRQNEMWTLGCFYLSLKVLSTSMLNST